jgi:hypothetical protein
MNAHDDADALQQLPQNGVCAAPQLRRSKRLRGIALAQPTEAATSLEAARLPAQGSNSRQLSHNLRASHQNAGYQSPYIGSCAERQHVSKQRRHLNLHDRPWFNRTMFPPLAHTLMIPSTHVQCLSLALTVRSMPCRDLLLTLMANLTPPISATEQTHMGNGIKPSQRPNSPMHCNASTAQTPQPVVHSKRSPPRASHKRRPSVAKHMELQGPRTR